MKRKLEHADDLSPKPKAPKPDTTQQPEAEPSFADLGLDARLLQAVVKQSFEKPTLVQRKTIPLALDGKDVLATADCGSGKTAAYLLPVLSGILKRKMTDSAPSTSALVLVPTRELADQVFKALEEFSAFCAKDMQAAKLTDKLSDAVQRSLLSSSPDIVISTPATAWHNVDSSALSLESLDYLVLDEVDLVLSYGYDEDLENISRSVPKAAQMIMMSATFTAEMSSLQRMFGRKLPLLDLKEPEAEGEGVAQFVVKCGEDEKFLLAYVIFKLQLIKGKCIIFVSDIDRCYRLKLFLEQFGIKSCVMNSELPVNSRIHIIEEFNRGIYDIIIASDERNELLGDEEKTADDKTITKAASGDHKQEDDADPAEAPDSKRAKKRRKSAKRDQEYGISRGIDFKNVASVINFDLPVSASSYTHRIGRTARAGRSGMALSFVVPRELYRKHVPSSTATAENDEKILARVVKQQARLGKEVKPYNFSMDQIESFRYRMNDALRAVTKVAIREARTRELRQELLKSEKLKRYFEENPGELSHLRHDGELRTARQQAHLKHIPDYLLPRDGKKSLTQDEQSGFVPFRKEGGKDRDSRKKRGHHKGARQPGRAFKAGGGSRKRDPLKTFKARRKTS